jgi:hypothetical protein
MYLQLWPPEVWLLDMSEMTCVNHWCQFGLARKGLISSQFLTDTTLCPRIVCSFAPSSCSET